MHVPQTEVILRHHDTELLRVTLPPGEYVIGRSPEVAICAETPLLSRQHALLTIEYDQLFLQDLGSSNGTFVNDQPVTEITRLFPNQSIRLGPDLTLEVHRQRASPEPGVSLAPVQAAIRRHLPDELLGEKRYVIGGIIARGGMGAILDAQQRANQRTVAMKVMLGAGDEADVLRFIEEAQITSQLEHPNIVPIYELGLDEQGQLFYTMKMVRGSTLKKVLADLAGGDAQAGEKYPLPVLLTIFQKVGDALAFAHSKGVIHRDLKPENIMIGDFGSVLLMDWGLAKVLGKKNAPAAVDTPGGVVSARAAEPEVSATMAGTIMGTPAYMSPEQARGEIETLDARSDIYALGTILFEILHLRPAVTGRAAIEIVDKVQRGEVEWGAGGPARALPDSLLAICRQALALDAAARYPSVEAFQADLLAYQNGFATSAEKADALKQFTLLVKRHQAASIGVAAVLLIGGVLGTKAIVEGRRAEREAVRANRALADLKKQAPGLRELAESEAAFQRFDSALAKLDGTIALEPEFLPAYWRRAWLLMGMERFGDAASAIRLAQEKDPANAKLAAILPVIEQLAAADSDAGRWSPERATAVLGHLRKVGASREIVALSAKLQIGAKDKLALVQKRIEEWLGKERKGNLSIDAAGLVVVDIGAANLETLEPLRGLPIEKLKCGGAKLVSLEPLRGMQLREAQFNGTPNLTSLLKDLSPLAGMPLTRLDIPDTGIKDLSPLAGMPLTSLNIQYTSVQDLSPLKGMPLTTLTAGFTKVIDLSPLAGAPLRRLDLNNTQVTDFTPMKGAPLEWLSVRACKSVDLTPITGAPLKEVDIGHSKIKDLKFLQDSPITKIDAEQTLIADLSPLRGKPLRYLNIPGTKISDLSPLRGMPIEVLIIWGTKVTDFSPLLDLPKLERVRVSKAQMTLEPLRRHPTLKFIGYGEAEGYKPVAEFWAEYDARQAAGKK